MFWAQEQKILKYFDEGRRNSNIQRYFEIQQLGTLMDFGGRKRRQTNTNWELVPYMLPCVLPYMLPCSWLPYMLPCVEIWWKEKASWELVALCPPVPWEFWPIYGALLV